jgi:hypothetical protein
MDSTQIIYSNYDGLIKKFDLFAFDFDLTVLKIHAYANEITASQVESMGWRKLSDHFADPIFFRDLINYLISKKKKVAIVSFGTYNVIKAYLDRLFDDSNVFGRHNIMTPLCGNQRYGRNIRQQSDKNELFIELARNLEIKYSRILFFDDDLNNIDHANELGIIGVHVQKGGFNRIVWKELVNDMVGMVGMSGGASTNTIDLENNKKSSKRNNRDNIVLEKFENPTEKEEKKEESEENIVIKTIKKRGGNKIVEDEPVDVKETNNEGDGQMTYYISWLNMFAAIFIAAYWIIKKIN